MNLSEWVRLQTWKVRAFIGVLKVRSMLREETRLRRSPYWPMLRYLRLRQEVLKNQAKNERDDLHG